MFTHADEKVAQAIKRLRVLDDFDLVVKFVEDRRSELTEHCVTVAEEVRLRQFQGGAQALTRLLEILKRS